MSESYFVERKAKLEKEIERFSSEITRCPAGTLVASQKQGKTRWYHYKKKKDGSYERKYINNENRLLAQKLARKAYIKAFLKDSENELKSIDKYLKTRKTKYHRELLEAFAEYRTFLEHDRWDMEEYDKNQSYPEALLVKAPKGEFVRSKSEALIANALFDVGLQYRYECGLVLDGFTIYPDFTIKTENNNLLLWEHFGKMDDPEYLKKVNWKMDLYMKNGYYPGKNLLVTYETQAKPLIIEDVMKVIADNLLHEANI